MKIINNNEEFDTFYPYDKKYIKEYPKEYPCVVYWDWEGGGLMGEYKQVYVAYFPKDVSIEEAFLIGLEYSWTKLK